MAEAKAKEKMVKVKLPRAEKGQSDTQYVGANFKGYLIKRGVEVEVPEVVANILADSEKAKDDNYHFLEEKTSE